MNPKVDKFLSSAKQWREEIVKLREIILNCGLREELKWGKPCYLYDNDNIVIIQAFKEYFALGFFNGYLLKDSKNILIAPGENSQTMRQIRFTNVQEIIKKQSTLKAYIYEAIEVEKASLKDKLKKKPAFKIPEEFQNRLDDLPALKSAFESLTPGRQRAYLIYFSQAKHSQTRESRIEKYIPLILMGKGMND